MTIAHTLDDIYLPAAPLPSIHSLAGLGAFFARPVLRLRNRIAVRRFERYSNHLLRDIGFERDWDGSIIGGDRSRSHFNAAGKLR
ncbi:hypothetical protein FHX14_000214 [Rhizobium sp. BK619]|uniref:hypothetical protein n=1 Tax=Rhizobium sp. BK619 TaxID=2586989 RepID=UPI00161754D4|nr:hypothetical protein [Rhizobium sp. BK619]MBB3644055.1 hypothetical protein [Rhizobium sp. BK619]